MERARCNPKGQEESPENGPQGLDGEGGPRSGVTHPVQTEPLEAPRHAQDECGQNAEELAAVEWLGTAQGVCCSLQNGMEPLVYEAPLSAAGQQ